VSIRPTQGTTAAPPSIVAPAETVIEGAEFASTLAGIASQAGSADPEHIRPPAERWGQYGDGAKPGGYGPPPDPAQFAQFPVGSGSPASPLNPNGITMDPAFTVDGYTGRGTPIPPGFYNLAYYNQYLREGGTPLVGFAALEPGASVTATYGTYGDGRVRATSFADGFADVTNTLAGTSVAIGDASAEATVEESAPAADAESAGPAAPDVANAAATPAAADKAVACAVESKTTAAPPHATKSDTPQPATTSSTQVTATDQPDGQTRQGATRDVDLGRAALEAQIASLIDVLLRG
jgi:hypothetical protein